MLRKSAAMSAADALATHLAAMQAFSVRPRLTYKTVSAVAGPLVVMDKVKARHLAPDRAAATAERGAVQPLQLPPSSPVSCCVRLTAAAWARAPSIPRL